jgi:hypothetical protein
MRTFLTTCVTIGLNVCVPWIYSVRKGEQTTEAEIKGK